MSAVAVITDSTAYLPDQLLTQFQIGVVPLNVIWDNQTYQDGIDITPEDFYTRLQNSQTLPSTSQPSAAAFQAVFKDYLKLGRPVLAVLISSEISGTVNSALQAVQDLNTDQVRVVDSRTAGMATGLHVLAAARAAADGANLEETQAAALKAQDHTEVIFVVDTLEFLHRGGRIGGAKRLLGSMLNIKPILEMRGGKIEPLEQVRTQQKALDRMIELMLDKIGDDRPVRIAGFHSQAPELTEELLARTEEHVDVKETFRTVLSPVIGTHVGPGTVALAAMHGM
jgi:DegV family protein with EDD domain